MLLRPWNQRQQDVLNGPMIESDRNEFLHLFQEIVLESKARQLFITPREQKSNFGLAVWDSSPEHMPEAHAHNDIEVNYLDSGAFTYLYGGQMVRVEPGRVAVFWAGRPHQVILVDEGARFHGLSLPLGWFLNWRLPEEFVSEILRGDLIEPPLTPDVAGVGARIDQWIEDLIEDSMDRRRVMLVEIEAWLRRVALSMDPNNGYMPKSPHGGTHIVEAALEKVGLMARFVNEHYTDEITVPEIAHAVGLHPNYAVQLFKKKTGMTLVEFIARQRLAHAQLHLATTDRSVLDIALEAGFGSASRFYAVFRKAFGMSPNEYRTLIHAPRG